MLNFPLMAIKFIIANLDFGQKHEKLIYETWNLYVFIEMRYWCYSN